MEQKPSAPEAVKVILRHPHTGDTVALDNVHDILVPYMVLGYSQVKPETPAGE